MKFMRKNRYKQGLLIILSLAQVKCVEIIGIFVKPEQTPEWTLPLRHRK